MKKIIERPGKTKQELLESLSNLKEKFKSEIADNNVEVTEIPDGYRVRGEKRFIVKFYVDAQIIAMDGAYELSWESNAPQSKIEEAIQQIENVLKNN